MLVYCSHLSILPNTPIEDLLVPVATWLGHKTKSVIQTKLLTSAGNSDFPDHSRLEVVVSEKPGVQLIALRYSHADRFVSGRTWFTELGIKREPGAFGCSFLLRTDETSALVAAPVETTRPMLVAKILEHCRMSATSRGGKAKPLTLEDAEGFEYVVRDPEREYPIVQVSALQDGTFAVDPDRLASFLIGVADVVAIPPGVDTFALEDRLGARYSCFHGAVNVVWPLVRGSGGDFAPATRIMAARLLELRSQGEASENHVLAVVCHRTNAPYSRRHLTPEAVHSALLRDAMETAKASGAKPDAEFAAILHRVDHDQQEEISRLKTDLAGKESETSALQSQVDTLAGSVESLKQSITAMSQSSRASTPAALSTADRKALVAGLTDEPSLTEALALIGLLFPDRVVILDSASKSARDADGFQHPRRAFGLLATLCGDYWDALAAGKSDAEARGVLGNAFSARESETVEKNRKARALRTFTYKGNEIEMMMHLRIGVKPSRHEAWRCHFEWDATDKRIVIGHCGEHLDHK